MNSGEAERMGETAEKLSRLRAQAMVTMADLEGNLAEIAASFEGNPDDEHDPEGSTLAYERARISSLLDQIRHTVSEFDRSLDRIRRGTYGVCESCGMAISPERLEAIPTTTFCVVCAGSQTH